MEMGGVRIVRAAFDVPADPRDRDRERIRGLFHTPPVRTLSASRPDQVPGVVAQAEAAARSGSWVLGGLRYEAGSAWDRAQVTRHSELPLAHFEVYPGTPDPWPADDVSLPKLDWLEEDRFGPDQNLTAIEAIQNVRDHIAAGDCYQVNLTTRVRTPSGPDLFSLFRGLVAAQPGGYALYLRGGGVASVSPELFFQWSPGPEDRVLAQPMKGTAARGTDDATDTAAAAGLVASAKERAENLMIVDLLRNDLSRVCRPGTVGVDALFELLALPTVWQLTSTISGRPLPGIGLPEVMGALFPCGSVTGAPKIRAMATIVDLEPEPRGWYCGALGLLRPGGEATFNVPIRTVEIDRDSLACGVGSGIVADSDPVAEQREWRAKARFLGGTPLAALETMLLVDGRILRIDRHHQRLARTAAALGLSVDRDTVAARLAEAERDHPSGRFRVRLVAGPDQLSVQVTEAPVTDLPVRLQLARTPLDTRGRLSRVIVNKTTHRAHYQALRDLADPGIFDVICHTPRGEITECTTGNIALLIDGQWLTPEATVGLLPGVLREELLETGVLREARLDLADLARAQEVAFLNGLRGWCPAVVVDL